MTAKHWPSAEPCVALGEVHLCHKRIQVRGVVQGVGFRPFVYRLAHDHDLKGWVRNTSAGVEIALEGEPAQLEAFLVELKTQAPPLAHIEAVEVTESPPEGYSAFEIVDSQERAGHYQLISPDIATCADCRREIFDPLNRRYRYPFTNCTNCGPRFTIIEDIPYDRPKTTMRAFKMCPDCQREYDDPLDRRFHAQPNACPACGPSLTLTDSRGNVIAAEDVIKEAARLLIEGRVLALKGLGGFHLACDATNPGVVQLLRERKRRPDKPFAVMIATLDDIRRHCQVSAEEEALLTSPQCPIVLLPWRADSSICEEVAPRYRFLGAMLPYTPLHHILLREVGRPLVMTSGNLSEEPIAQENEEALRRLGALADYFVLHNRGIYSRYDDSVWFVPAGGAQPIRRARGYAPFPIRLPFELPQLLACGPELKNTFCLTKENYAFLSQHIGDMENLETLEHFERTIALYRRLFRIEPSIVAYDLHPDYLSTRYAMELKKANPALQLAPVQHHHAHIASCLADNGWAEDAGPVIGVALDGTGYGSDGHIWGGEFLIADYRQFKRAGRFQYLPLVGGEAGIKNPYRLAIAFGYHLGGQAPRVPSLEAVAQEEIALIQRQVERGLNTALTSSCGRLFDAVAALCGIGHRVTYEAQAAIELEMLSLAASEEDSGENPYPFDIASEQDTYVVYIQRLWQAIVNDLQTGVEVPRIGRRFHRTIAEIVLAICLRLREDSGLNTVSLSGGCFQNRLLLAMTIPLLREAGFVVLTHKQVPCNDGGIALGQAVIAGLRASKSKEI